MLRVKTVLTMTGVVLAAAAAGCAIGFMVAPASGQEIRRRIGWRVTDQWRSLSRSCDRAADRAKRQIDERKRQITEVIGA